MATDVVELEQALERLEAEGARGYDAPACDCVRNLLTRAEDLSEGARQRLLARAEHHLQRLHERYRRERARAEQRLEKLQSDGVATGTALVRSLERGELSRIHRTARRAKIAPKRHAMILRDPHQDSAESQALDVDPYRRRRRSALRYEGSMSELMASFALARSVEAVPEDAGPYNPKLIAHRALDTMRRVSPLYLRVQLERLDELGSLLQLPAPEPPPPPKRPKAAPKKRAPKAGAGKKRGKPKR